MLEIIVEPSTRGYELKLFIHVFKNCYIKDYLMDIIFEKCNMKAFKILKYCIYKICA